MATTAATEGPVAAAAPTPTKRPAPDLQVRLVFTSLEIESRLAVVALLHQMQSQAQEGVVPPPSFRLVDSVSEATHVIAEKLQRTPKIYHAVALGKPIVTPKWVQASVIRGDWVGEWPLVDLICWVVRPRYTTHHQLRWRAPGGGWVLQIPRLFLYGNWSG